MVKRALLIGLLGISLAALPMNEAHPGATCSIKQGGTCLVWSYNSIACQIQATGVQEEYYLACTITGTDNWLVVCQNQGGNEAPGINVATFSGTFNGVYDLTNHDISRNGTGSGLAIADPSDSLIQAIGDVACPNYNWTALDALPITMQVRDMTLDENKCVISDAWYECTLPNPETLQWYSNTQSFEQRQYECTQISRNNYSVPQYIDGSSPCPVTP
jgi:hypothetical protein